MVLPRETPAAPRTTTPPSQCAQSPEQPTCGPRVPRLPGSSRRGHVDRAGIGRHLPPSLLLDKNGSPFSHPPGTPAAVASGRTGVISGAQASIPGVLCWVLSLPWPSPAQPSRCQGVCPLAVPMPHPSGLVYQHHLLLGWFELPPEGRWTVTAPPPGGDLHSGHTPARDQAPAASPPAGPCCCFGRVLSTWNVTLFP